MHRLHFSHCPTDHPAPGDDEAEQLPRHSVEHPYFRSQPRVAQRDDVQTVGRRVVERIFGAIGDSEVPMTANVIETRVGGSDSGGSGAGSSELGTRDLEQVNCPRWFQKFVHDYEKRIEEATGLRQHQVRHVRLEWRRGLGALPALDGRRPVVSSSVLLCTVFSFRFVTTALYADDSPL